MVLKLVLILFWLLDNSLKGTINEPFSIKIYLLDL